MGDIVKLLKIGTQHYNFLKSNDMIAKVSKHWGYIKKSFSVYIFYIRAITIYELTN